MAIPSMVLSTLPQPLAGMLQQAERTQDWNPIDAHLDTLKSGDPHMTPWVAGERRTRYYKSFVQTIVPKIVPALKDSSRTGLPPEIRVTFSDIDTTRERLGIPVFGSPQDVLYTFTSERAKGWDMTLEGMGFRSACMTGQAEMTVTTAERLLLPKPQPDDEVREMAGAIGGDFWACAAAIFDDIPIREDLALIAQRLGKGPELASCLEMGREQATLLVGQLIDQMASSTQLGPLHSQVLRIIRDLGVPEIGRRLFRPRKRAKAPQEQIALKYAEEGGYLKKLLGGKPLEHFQSNVKMQPNMLRKSKCEIDSIYKIVGEKKVVLVEAKGTDRVSRAQLYQAYETFRLRLPLDWDLIVVAILMSPPSPSDRCNGVEAIIDLIRVGFEDAAFGKITESLYGMRPDRHVRWKIVSASAAT